MCRAYRSSILIFFYSISHILIPSFPIFQFDKQAIPAPTTTVTMNVPPGNPSLPMNGTFVSTLSFCLFLICRAYRSFILILLYSISHFLITSFLIFQFMKATQAGPPISFSKSDDTSVSSVPIAAGPVPAADASAPATVPTVPSIFDLQSTDGSKEFLNATDDRSIPLGDFLRNMQLNKNIYGDDTEKINSLSSNTSKHEKDKVKMEARFFASLQENKTLKYLSVFVKDPNSARDTLVRQLYVYCRGVITTDSYEIMNTALIWFSKSYIKLEFIGMDLSDDLELFVRAQYQPNTVAKNFRCLFSIFKSNQVHFSLANDFNGKGTLYSICMPACGLLFILYLFHLTLFIVHHSICKSFYLFISIKRRTMFMVETQLWYL
jgi:hypothetical protein